MDDGRQRQQYATSANLDARIALHMGYSTAAVSWYSWVLGLLGLRPGDRVLEVGCGTGQLWRANAGRIPADVSLTLTDASAGMIERARDAVPAAFHVVDAEQLTFPAASFDVVVANHMLYHVAEPATAIAEAARVLAPSGRFVATTNGVDHLRELNNLIARHARQDWKPFDLARFSLETGRDVLRATFHNAHRDAYENRLRVTDVDALVAYVASMPTRPGTLDLPALRAEAAAQIGRDGAFVITTQSGAFTASLPGR